MLDGMAEERHRLRGRSELGVIAGWLVTAATLAVALLSAGALRIAAFAVLGLLVAWMLVGDFFLALADERAARRNPHANRASDVGRIVRVVDKVTGSDGKVSLGGETWSARSRDGTVHEAGEELVVVDIRRLVLIVAPRSRR